MGDSEPDAPVTHIPWRLLLSKAPVWALIICHFCHNWGTFILLTWMPTYYNQVRIVSFCVCDAGLLQKLFLMISEVMHLASMSKLKNPGCEFNQTRG